jgi:restriction endonuclease Mrr
MLPRITELIHQMNRSKEFERFLHRIFESMPNVESIPNGFGWGTDHGADLIVTFQNPLIGVNLTSRFVVQAKSYEGDHNDLNAVDQLVEGIRKYNADGGLLITTAQKTERLEDYVRRKVEENGKVIDVIAGADVARFVIRYAPDMLVGID